MSLLESAFGTFPTREKYAPVPPQGINVITFLLQKVENGCKSEPLIVYYGLFGPLNGGRGPKEELPLIPEPPAGEDGLGNRYEETNYAAN